MRDAGRTGALQQTAQRLGIGLDIRSGGPDAPLPPADVVISTLPGDAAYAFAGHAWEAGSTLLDVVYAPWPTRIARAAQDAGCRVVDGLAVLLHQATAQVELMTGTPAPVEAMRSALLAAVGRG